MFHNPPVKAPALVLASRNDPICSFREMMGVMDGWQEQNVKVSTAYSIIDICQIETEHNVSFVSCVQITMKIWDDSPHVGHMRRYRKEYIAELNDFLETLNLPVVHDSEADKITSKL